MRRIRRRGGRDQRFRWVALGLSALLVGSAVTGYYLYRHLAPDIPAPALRPTKLPPPNPQKAVYPYSVVRGGVHDGKQVWQAIYDDAIVAEHYADLHLNRLRVVRPLRPVRGHVSYRVGTQVYWTKGKHTVPAGEALIGDGENLVRARCGNRVSELARFPIREDEPSEEILGIALDEVPAPFVAPGLPDSEYFSWIGPKSPPPYIDFAMGGLPPLALDYLLLTPGEVQGSAAVFPGYGPAGIGLGGGLPPAASLLEPLAPGNLDLPSVSPTEPEIPPAPPGPQPEPPAPQPPGPGPGPGPAPGPEPELPPEPPTTPPGPGPVSREPATPPGPGPTPPGPGPTPPARPPDKPVSPATPPYNIALPDRPPYRPESPLLPEPVPEPATVALTLAGLAALGLWGRRSSFVVCQPRRPLKSDGLRHPR